ncbi:MAG: sigma-70 family RNA polymerase sigma factor [Saprospiraceae bacterium]|nr:sigma-70 family RNA polymerase sigma factor [Saprospiraceae bacterium]
MEVLASKYIAECEFVERLKRAEHSAYSELYDRYGQAIYKVIFEIAKSEPDTENLVQDTFVKIWRNIQLYEPTKGRLFTWLVIIARRVALDFVRSNYFLEKRKIQNEESAVAVAGPAPEMQRLDYLGLEKELDKLDSHLKQMIDYQYFRGYTMQEIADETGLPLGTVKTRTRTALLILRKNLKNV